MKPAPTSTERDESLALRAAWLHYVGGLTQAEVAKRLGLPSVKTHRMIARMVAEGAVKVSIDGDIVACVALEDRLRAKFALNFCHVAPDLGEEGLPVRALGMAGADYLRNLLIASPSTTLGLGHGRTLSAAIHQLPRIDAPCLAARLFNSQLRAQSPRRHASHRRENRCAGLHDARAFLCEYSGRS